MSNSKQPQQHLKPRLRADISCSHYLVWDAGRGLEYILLHRVCILASIYFDSFEYGTFFQLMFHKNWRLWRPFEASRSVHTIHTFMEKNLKTWQYEYLSYHRLLFQFWMCLVASWHTMHIKRKQTIQLMESCIHHKDKQWRSWWECASV